MNIFYHDPTYIEIQKIQDLCQYFIIIFIICFLRHFDKSCISVFY